MRLALLTGCLAVLTLPYASGLFFTGGATITVGAGLANALVLKGLLAAKLGLVGGLLAASRSSSSTSHHRPSYKHHRGKRSPLFFDGGATLTISTAALANALVAKALILKGAAVGAGIGAALRGRGSSRRSSHRPSYSKHHRGKRSPLFFDGGATLTISTAALANALVAKALILKG